MTINISKIPINISEPWRSHYQYVALYRVDDVKVNVISGEYGVNRTVFDHEYCRGLVHIPCRAHR